MDLKGLKYFITAAEQLNFTKAATLCFITQTAMSNHIAKMEEELGFQLFRRSNRKVELTPAGETFYNQSCQIVQTYEEAVRKAAETASGNGGSMTLLFPSCMEGLLFMPAIRKFRASHPNLDIRTKIAEPHTFHLQLLKKESSLAICWPHDLEKQEELEKVPIASFPLYLYAQASHPLFDLPCITPRHLSRESCVILEPRKVPNSYRNMRNSWVEAGLEPDRLIKRANMEEILLTLECEPAVALLPSYVNHYLTTQIFSAPIKGAESLRMELCGFYLREKDTGLMERFLKEAIFYLSDHRHEKTEDEPNPLT